MARPRSIGDSATSAGPAWAVWSLVLLSAGCVDPSVDRVVAWVDSVDEGSSRGLQVYDRGRLYTLDIEPLEDGAATELLSIAVDRRGRGIAASGKNNTVFVGLRDTRMPTLQGGDLLGGELEEEFMLTRNGDALLRGFEGSGMTRPAFTPISSDYAGVTEELLPPTAVANGTFSLLQASNAPILVWTEQNGNPARGWGRLQAVAYPSDVGPEAPSVDTVTVLGEGEVFGSAGPEGSAELRIPDTWCKGRVCVSPDGRSTISMGGGRCEFWWWRWADAVDGELAEPEPVQITDGCPPEPRAEPSLVAQIGFDLAVLDDDQRVYLADLSAGTMKAAPKLWDSAGSMQMTDAGRVVVLVAADSRVVRIDADGPRVLSTESVPCLGPASTPRVSPNGMWTVRTCNGDGTFIPEEQGVIIRVSPLGLESFASVPMEPLGIDDQGAALLYSRSDSGEPRGLFVLDSDGAVSRIDPLEPEPEQLGASYDSDINVYFASQSLQPQSR